MKPKQPALQVFALLVLVLFSCTKKGPCDGKDPGKETYITPQQVEAKNFFKGYDTLRFLNLVDSVPTDTITLIGQGRTYDTTFIADNSSNCQPDEYGQRFQILYKSNKPEYNLTFTAWAVTGDGDVHFTIKFLGQTLDDNFDRVNWHNYAGYYPYRYINGKDYYNVNLFSNRGDCHCFNMYYTSDEGIIRMELKPHQVWQLID